MNKYYFCGIRFVPGYNDIDFDDATIEAATETEAWEKLWKLTKKFTWQNVALTEVNGVKVAQ